VYTGIEASFEAFLSPEFSFGANYTWIDGENKTDVDLPVGEGANKKANLNVNYTDGQGRWWAGYHFRYQAEQQDAILGTSPVGLVLPGFSVHNVRGGFRFFTAGWENRLDIALNNLTNELYAEASNATFFRPEPGRSVSLTISTAF
jgi:outer membrane receptor for ferrienterochelin and colicin